MIIATILGVLFLIWGILQFKTQKILFLNKNKKSIEAPREVSLILFSLSLLALSVLLVQLQDLLLYNQEQSILSSDLRYGLSTVCSVTCLVIWLAFPGLLILLGIIDLAQQRVFFLRNTTKTRKYIRKYYKLIGGGCIMSGSLIFAAMFLHLVLQHQSLLYDIMLWAGLAILYLVPVLFYLKIESSAKSVERHKNG